MKWTLVLCSFFLLSSSSLFGQDDFHFARLKYPSGEGSMYPYSAEDHEKFWGTDFNDTSFIYGGEHTTPDYVLTQELNRMTTIKAGDPAQVDIGPELFKYPFVYAVEVEQLDLSTKDALTMREYLTRGGFWMMDDFHGTKEWNHVVKEIHKVLPKAKVYKLSTDHEIFHSFFDIDELLQVPYLMYGEWCSSSFAGYHDVVDPRGVHHDCMTWEEDGYDPEYWAVDCPDRTGNMRMCMLLSFNEDLGDGLESIEQWDYPVRFSKFAVQMFINAVVYAMAH